MTFIRGQWVLKIRLPPPLPPQLTSLVPKTLLKKFLASRNLQEVLGPQRGDQSACKEIFTLEPTQQLTSVSPQMVSPQDKGFLFPKTSVKSPSVSGKLQITGVYWWQYKSHCCHNRW